MPGGSILAPFRLLFGSPGPLKKQLKVCNYRQIQRFGPFETESFCRPRSGRRFDEEFFEMCAILCFFEAPSLAQGAQESAREQETSIRQSDHQALDRTRPGVPDGTVADITRNRNAVLADSRYPHH